MKDAMNRYFPFFAAAVAAASPALAQESANQQQQRPEAFEALVRCRAIADATQRLQCFDTAAANLQQAAERRDLVVVDREQVRANRRRLFGLPIPGLGDLFGRDDDEEDEVRSIDSTVVSAEQGAYGRWIVTLEDGSIWAQTDNNQLALRPRRGQPVHVERGAMGSYMMRVNNQPGVRVRRQL